MGRYERRYRDGGARGDGDQHRGKALAALPIATGAVFLWAFLDKLVGLGCSTPSETGAD